jgi:cysteine desulfurase
MSLRPIYLDNNATTPVDAEVLARMDNAWRTAFANPGSSHDFGRQARRLLEDSRESIARILGADASELIFTSGGTESLNAAIHGFTFGRRGVIGVTAGEHPATLRALEMPLLRGCGQTVLPVDSNGRLLDAALDRLPWEELILVCVILAHNETGVIQDLRRLSQLCAERRVPLLVDAVQAVGKIPVNFSSSGATALAFGAHKFHGPRGVGGLLLRRGVRIPPLLQGGHQEHDRRAGTEPVALIAGMAAALEVWQREQADSTQRVQTLRDELQDALQQHCPPVVIHATGVDRLPNTLSVAFPGLSGESLLVNLHLLGVACSLGSTCASGAAEPAPALLAMGVEPDVCKSTVRFSLSRHTTHNDIHEAAQRIVSTVRRMRSPQA